MEFVFPKDEELFQDLKTVDRDLSYEGEYYLGMFDDDRGTFGQAFREVQGKQRAEKGVRLHARGSTPSELVAKMQKQRDAYFRKRYEELEAVADRFAAGKKIGAFPNAAIEKVVFKDDEGDTEEYNLDYFNEMNKACGFMRAAGRVGGFLYSAQQDLNTIKRKTPFLSFITLFILFVGVAVVLAGAQPIDFLPKFMVQLVTEKFLVRLVLLVLMALTGWFLVMVGPPEEGNWLFKFFANGIFLFLVAIGSTLVAMKEVFSGSEIEWYSLLPFGAYYVLFGIILVFADIADFFQKKKAARQAKKDFCARVERSIHHMHRYIRFHVLWWQTQKPGESFPSGINNLQKSFDHLLKMYKKYC